MLKHLEKSDNFENLIKEGNYLVDFYANWCGPCKMIAPVLEELTDVNIIKIDIDMHHDVANQYGVMSIPTLIYFKDGKEIIKEVGFRNKAQIEEMIKKAI